MKKRREDSSLLHRYTDDLYTVEDVNHLQHKLNENFDNELFDELSKTIWEESRIQQTDKETERYKKEARILLHKLGHKKKIKIRKLWHIVSSIAAVLCIVLGGIKCFQLLNRDRIVYQEVCTSYGEHKEIRLSDGTILILNACSYVRYPNYFVGKERRIELDGEGYFKVKHDEDHPFIIQTNSLDVKVLGTCFNVKSYSSDETVSVNVESGKVQVDLPEAMMRLKANEEVLLNKISGNYIKKNGNSEVAEWRMGNLCFNATPIHDVAKELERRYNCHISFANGQEFDNLISGEHDNKNLETVLQSIEYTSGIHYKISGNQVLLYKM